MASELLPLSFKLNSPTNINYDDVPEVVDWRMLKTLPEAAKLAWQKADASQKKYNDRLVMIDDLLDQWDKESKEFEELGQEIWQALKADSDGLIFPEGETLKEASVSYAASISMEKSMLLEAEMEVDSNRYKNEREQRNISIQTTLLPINGTFTLYSSSDEDDDEYEEETENEDITDKSVRETGKTKNTETDQNIINGMIGLNKTAPNNKTKETKNKQSRHEKTIGACVDRSKANITNNTGRVLKTIEITDVENVTALPNINNSRVKNIIDVTDCVNIKGVGGKPARINKTIGVTDVENVTALPNISNSRVKHIIDVTDCVNIKGVGDKPARINKTIEVTDLAVEINETEMESSQLQQNIENITDGANLVPKRPRINKTIAICKMETRSSLKPNRLNKTITVTDLIRPCRLNKSITLTDYELPSMIKNSNSLEYTFNETVASDDLDASCFTHHMKNEFIPSLNRKVVDMKNQTLKKQDNNIILNSHITTNNLSENMNDINDAPQITDNKLHVKVDTLNTEEIISATDNNNMAIIVAAIDETSTGTEEIPVSTENIHAATENTSSSVTEEISATTKDATAPTEETLSVNEEILPPNQTSISENSHCEDDKPSENETDQSINRQNTGQHTQSMIFEVTLEDIEDDDCKQSNMTNMSSYSKLNYTNGSAGFYNPNDTGINVNLVKKVYENYLDDDLNFFNPNETVMPVKRKPVIMHEASNEILLQDNMLHNSPKLQDSSQNAKLSDSTASSQLKSSTRCSGSIDFHMSPYPSSEQSVIVTSSIPAVDDSLVIMKDVSISAPIDHQQPADISNIQDRQKTADISNTQDHQHIADISNTQVEAISVCTEVNHDVTMERNKTSEEVTEQDLTPEYNSINDMSNHVNLNVTPCNLVEVDVTPTKLLEVEYSDTKEVKATFGKTMLSRINEDDGYTDVHSMNENHNTEMDKSDTDVAPTKRKQAPKKVTKRRKKRKALTMPKNANLKADKYLTPIRSASKRQIHIINRGQAKKPKKEETEVHIIKRRKKQKKETKEELNFKSDGHIDETLNKSDNVQKRLSLITSFPKLEDSKVNLSNKEISDLGKSQCAECSVELDVTTSIVSAPGTPIVNILCQTCICHLTKRDQLHAMEKTLRLRQTNDNLLKSVLLKTRKTRKANKSNTGGKAMVLPAAKPVITGDSPIPVLRKRKYTKKENEKELKSKTQKVKEKKSNETEEEKDTENKIATGKGKGNSVKTSSTRNKKAKTNTAKQSKNEVVKQNDEEVEFEEDTLEKKRVRNKKAKTNAAQQSKNEEVNQPDEEVEFEEDALEKKRARNKKAKTHAAQQSKNEEVKQPDEAVEFEDYALETNRTRNKKAKTHAAQQSKNEEFKQTDEEVEFEEDAVETNRTRNKKAKTNAAQKSKNEVVKQTDEEVEFEEDTLEKKRVRNIKAKTNAAQQSKNEEVKQPDEEVEFEEDALETNRARNKKAKTNTAQQSKNEEVKQPDEEVEFEDYALETNRTRNKKAKTNAKQNKHEVVKQRDEEVEFEEDALAEALNDVNVFVSGVKTKAPLRKVINESKRKSKKGNNVSNGNLSSSSKVEQSSSNVNNKKSKGNNKTIENKKVNKKAEMASSGNKSNRVQNKRGRGNNVIQQQQSNTSNENDSTQKGCRKPDKKMVTFIDESEKTYPLRSHGKDVSSPENDVTFKEEATGPKAKKIYLSKLEVLDHSDNSDNSKVDIEKTLNEATTKKRRRKKSVVYKGRKRIVVQRKNSDEENKSHLVTISTTEPSASQEPSSSQEAGNETVIENPKRLSSILKVPSTFENEIVNPKRSRYIRKVPAKKLPVKERTTTKKELSQPVKENHQFAMPKPFVEPLKHRSTSSKEINLSNASSINLTRLSTETTVSYLGRKRKVLYNQSKNCLNTSPAANTRSKQVMNSTVNDNRVSFGGVAGAFNFSKLTLPQPDMSAINTKNARGTKYSCDSVSSTASIGIPKTLTEYLKKFPSH